ncbi:carbohydrate kinase [Pseudoalteromonas sp. S1610]|uniref:carbohydrate kinase family protein n=1 Tax=unclassified Pseudoalteromonas TaxID=194690 RepID=UPI00110BD410|nr:MULTISPECIES: carbohydrate kinase [unclassified Pseudoalteromonas]MCK8125247.1 carbohydrate kinase [Pseudoalteromonas sp. 2CM39R]TMP62894.1 carbohydrate kinase [Pseudoalteromonas sp. S1610]
MTKLLSLGELLIDMLPQDSQNSAYLPIPGGAPANVAVGYAKLGGKAAFCGGMGDDYFAKQLTNALEQYNVDTEYLFTIEGAQTAMVIVSLDESGERSFNFYRHQTADLLLTNEHLKLINWDKLSTLHFCSNTLTNTAIAKTTVCALKQAKNNHKLVSFDVNLRYSLWQNSNDIEQNVHACYAYCDIVKLSRDELNFLATQRQQSVEAYLQSLLELGVKLVFLTDGPAPATVYHNAFTLSEAAPTITAVDTTSAGDAFIAGVLYYLNHSDNAVPLTDKLNDESIVKKALHFGLRCGSKACLAKGAFPALPTQKTLSK